MIPLSVRLLSSVGPDGLSAPGLCLLPAARAGLTPVSNRRRTCRRAPRAAVFVRWRRRDSNAGSLEPAALRALTSHLPSSSPPDSAAHPSAYLPSTVVPGITIELTEFSYGVVPRDSTHFPAKLKKKMKSRPFVSDTPVQSLGANFMKLLGPLLGARWTL